MKSLNLMLTLESMWESRITPVPQNCTSHYSPKLYFWRQKDVTQVLFLALSQLKWKSLQTFLLQKICFGCQNITVKTFLPWGKHMTIWRLLSKISSFILCGIAILMCKCWYSEILLLHVLKSKAALPQLVSLFFCLLTACEQLWRVPHSQVIWATSKKWKRLKCIVTPGIVFLLSLWFYFFTITYSIFLSSLRPSFTLYSTLLSQVITVCVEGWQNTHLLHWSGEKWHIFLTIFSLTAWTHLQVTSIKLAEERGRKAVGLELGMKENIIVM